MDSPQSLSSSSSVAARESSWREWSQREAGADGYKFGDFSRGLLHQMKAGVRDLKHKVNEATLSIKEEHEQRTAEYVQSLAAADEDVQEMAPKAGRSVSTAAERFWTQLCKDAHVDHEDQAAAAPADCGSLEVQVLHLGTEERALVLERKPVEKPILLLCLAESRSKGLNEGSVATFQVKEILKADLNIYTFDRANTNFALGREHKAFAGGCVVPLSKILPEGSSALRSFFEEQRFSTTLRLQLLPLPVLRTRRKLQIGEQTGAKVPQEQLGEVVLKFTLNLTQSPARLYFLPSSCDAPEDQGHVSDPFSVIRAAGTAVSRLQQALKMELWQASFHEMRENRVLSPILLFWWTSLSLVAPLWTWPLGWLFFLGLLAWSLHSCQHQTLRLYVDEDGPKEAIDVVKEAVKASLHLMRLTERVNQTAAQLEKLKYILCLDDRPLSSMCFLLCLAFCVPLCVGSLVLQWICLSGFWRYLLWPSGCVLVLPQAMRSSILHELERMDELKRRALGDELERMCSSFWRRIPDATEAVHLYLFKHYVYRGVE